MNGRFTMRLGRVATALAALMLSGCLPLTLSHEGAIDFSRHRVVYIQPVATVGDLLDTGYSTGLQAYLADELRTNSGFVGITLDPRGTYDCVLSVELFIESDYDYDDREEEWDVEAEWTLRTLDGETIDVGSVHEDAADEGAAAEEAMDAIANRYLAPYRF